MAPKSELDGRDEEPEEEGAPRETGQRLPAAKGVDGESHRDDEDRDREDERAWERGGEGRRGGGGESRSQPAPRETGRREGLRAEELPPPRERLPREGGRGERARGQGRLAVVDHRRVEAERLDRLGELCLINQ